MREPERTEETKGFEEPHCSAAETSVDAVVTSDAGDRILTWNRGAEHMFGYGKEVLHEPLVLLIPERYRRAHTEGLRRFLATGEKRIMDRTVPLQALRKDGTEFPIELSLSSWRRSGAILFGAIIRDITERKRTENMRERVQRMLRHDLRSPLIGILGLTKVLERGAGHSESQQKALSMIRDLGAGMLKSMDRSRDLFQIEEGVYALEPKPVDLTELLDRAFQELKSLLSKRGVALEFLVGGRPAGGKPYRLMGDEGLLETMLINLLKNAAEAAPAGTTVRLRVHREEQGGKSFHVLDIHNHGQIPEDIRGRFLEPYVTSGKKGGSGLGAYSALLVARTHGGTLRFTTSPEEGTHVIVRLPREIQGSAKPQPPTDGA